MLMVFPKDLRELNLLSGNNDTTRLKSTLSNPLALNFNSYGDLYILDNVLCKIRAIGFDQVYKAGYDITNNIYNNPQLYVQNGELIDYSNGTNSVDIAISNTDIKYYTVPNGDMVRSIFYNSRRYYFIIGNEILILNVLGLQLIQKIMCM